MASEPLLWRFDRDAAIYLIGTDAVDAMERAYVIEPAESTVPPGVRLAVAVAHQQLIRGDNPPFNTTAVIVEWVRSLIEYAAEVSDGE